MKTLTVTLFFSLTYALNPGSLYSQGSAPSYPSVELANKMVKMKVYIPDSEKGFYRGTRFDWAGMIASLQYKGHEYFGEWRPSHDPLAPSDVTGPVDGYIKGGLGYEDAKPGDEIIRIGIGVLKKEEEIEFNFSRIYKFIDFGTRKTTSGKGWVEFTHEVKRPSGWGFIYTKRIELLKKEPGFKMSYTLKNTGAKTIETDQFNHNFFMIDKGSTGSDFSLKFPFSIKPDESPRNRPHPQVKYEGNEIIFSDPTLERDVWVSLIGYSKNPSDNGFELLNKKTGAGVKVQSDKPLHQLVFWATKNTLCPETFVYLNVAPGSEEKWSATYTFFTK